MMTEEVEHITKCPECLSRNIDTDMTRGETTCIDCGLVLDDNLIDPGAEWRIHTMEQGQDRSRTGAPMNTMLHDKGLSTDIDWQNRDYSGKKINDSRTRSQLYRMRKWQKRARIGNSQERNLAVALAEIDRMSSKLGLPKMVREASADLYRKCVEANLIRGRSIDAVTAASLYVACRQCNIPRTLGEIGSAARAGRKEIGRTERFIKRELKIRLPVQRAADYLARFSSMLGLDAQTELVARRMCDELELRELDSGRGPMGIAAATLYIASVQTGRRRTQKDVSVVCGVTEVTIRNRYKEIVNSLNLDLTI